MVAVPPGVPKMRFSQTHHLVHQRGTGFPQTARAKIRVGVQCQVRQFFASLFSAVNLPLLSVTEGSTFAAAA